MNARVTLANGKGFEAQPGVTLLEAASHAGLALPHSCRTGRCGSCKAKATHSRGRHLQGEDCLSNAEREAGWLLTCTDGADEALSLDLDDLAELASLRLLTLPARIASIERPAPEVLVLRLRLPPNHGLQFLAGQYLDLIAPGNIRRAYSIANADPAEGLELHIRRVDGGAMSSYLFERAKPNDLMRLQGPRGSFHLGEVAGLHLVWLATGTGIAPFKAMLESLQTRAPEAWPASIRLFWGNRLAEDLYWTPPALPGLQFTAVCSREPGWAGAQGHVQQHALIDAALPDRVYACGSQAMIDAASTAYAARGLPARHFHSDAFVSSS